MLFHSFMQMKRCHRAHFTAAITRKKENKHDNNMQLTVIKKILILKLIKINDNKKKGKVSMCTYIRSAAGAFPGFYATKHIASLQNEMVDHQSLTPTPNSPSGISSRLPRRLVNTHFDPWVAKGTKRNWLAEEQIRTACKGSNPARALTIRPMRFSKVANPHN